MGVAFACSLLLPITNHQPRAHAKPGIPAFCCSASQAPTTILTLHSTNSDTTILRYSTYYIQYSTAFLSTSNDHCFLTSLLQLLVLTLSLHDGSLTPDPLSCLSAQSPSPLYIRAVAASNSPVATHCPGSSSPSDAFVRKASNEASLRNRLAERGKRGIFKVGTLLFSSNSFDERTFGFQQRPNISTFLHSAQRPRSPRTL